jgi:hypothetical protein
MSEQAENLKQVRRLWSQQMEGTIDKAGTKHLNALTQDAELMEAFSEDREAGAHAEPAPELDWAKVDAAVKQTYHKQSISWSKALMVIAASVVVGLAASQWLLKRDWNAAEEKKTTPGWMHQGTETAKSKAVAAYREPAPGKLVIPSNASHLGGPPAASDLRVSPGPKGFKADLDQAHSGIATLVVVNAAGTPVRTLHVGQLQAGKWRFIWEGLDDTGKNPGPGKYKIKANVSGLEINREVEIYTAQ